MLNLFLKTLFAIPMAVNPSTGDPTRNIVTIMAILLVISAVVLLVYFITSKNKKGKGKRK